MEETKLLPFIEFNAVLQSIISNSFFCELIHKQKQNIPIDLDIFIYEARDSQLGKSQSVTWNFNLLFKNYFTNYFKQQSFTEKTPFHFTSLLNHPLQSKHMIMC